MTLLEHLKLKTYFGREYIPRLMEQDAILLFAKDDLGHPYLRSIGKDLFLAEMKIPEKSPTFIPFKDGTCAMLYTNSAGKDALVKEEWQLRSCARSLIPFLAYYENGTKLF